MLSSGYPPDGSAEHIMYVEFLGIPRERAGISELELEAGTLGQVLGELSARCPGLSELITPLGLHPSLAANLNGDEFVKSLDTRLAANDRLLILSADAGG
jgi:molybdopterin converting factor small subunit